TGIDMARTMIGGRQVPQPDPARIAASRYAGRMMDDGQVQGVLTLGNDADGRLSWPGGRHILLLSGGDLGWRTHGLHAPLDDMQLEGENPFFGLRRLGAGTTTVTRRYGWPDGYRYGIPVTGTVRRAGEETVEILGRARRLVRYEESLQGPGVEGRNTYWVDPADGRIWKSRQLVAPGTYVDLVVPKIGRASGRES